MPDMHGQFCWYELMTDDLPAATAFYTSVIGWHAREAGPPHGNYTILSAGEVGVGGLVEMPQRVREGGGRPFWISYIAVDDLDAAAAKVIQLGGQIHRPADEIPGVGRFAVAADQQGALFTLFTPLPSAMPPPAPAGATPGRVGWHELHAGEWEAAFAFYAEMFGWTKVEAIDMGPLGLYQMFSTGSGMAGGMLTKMDAMPSPVWLDYFNVDAIDAAIARTKEAGGTVLMGPQVVPGGSWIAQCRDPQGALFAMVGPRH